MNLVSEVIKEFKSVRKACLDAKVDANQLYRWIAMGALIDNAGNVFRYVDGATIDAEGEAILCKVYTLIGKFKSKGQVNAESAVDRIAELEKRLVAPTDSGIDELDYICKVFNSNEQDNLTSLVSLVWNKSRFEALKEQVK
jgi:hypothetical protein